MGILRDVLVLGIVEKRMWDWSINKKKEKGRDENYKKEGKKNLNSKNPNCPDCHENHEWI